MALPAATCVGVIAGIVVPWYTASQDPPIFGGKLDGVIVPLPVADGFALHWSSLVFAIVTVFTWILLKAAEQRN